MTRGPGDRPAGATRRLRILHVIDGLNMGGAEIILIRLIERLQAAGHENVVVSMMTPGRLAERIAASGATVEALHFARGRLPGPSVWRLARVFRRHRPDVVQGWMYHGNLAALAGRVLSAWPAPMAWSMHNTLDPPPDYRWHTRFAMRLGAAASSAARAIVYVSAVSVPQHERAGFRADRSVVIGNGTDCDLFRPDPAARERLGQALGVGRDRLLVGLFARWTAMKGHAGLIEAARMLRAEDRPLHLVLAGTEVTNGNPELTALIDEAGLAGCTSLLGERDDMPELMAGLDVFVLPSVWGEAFPLVLGEAMASGVPCLATDVGDCALILGDPALVVPPGDPTALAGALGRLLDLPAPQRRRLGETARSRVLDRFSLTRMAQLYERLYLDLATGRPVQGVQET